MAGRVRHHRQIIGKMFCKIKNNLMFFLIYSKVARKSLWTLKNYIDLCIHYVVWCTIIYWLYTFFLQLYLKWSVGKKYILYIQYKIIQWHFCLSLTTASAPHRDLTWSSSSLSGMTWRNRTNWDRLNPEELWQRLQDASRNLPAKLCASVPRTKAVKRKGWSHQMLIWFS